MLPDFPKIKERFVEAINNYLEILIRQEPFLSQIREEQHFEGNKTSSKDENEELYQSAYKEISSKIPINREDVIVKGPMAFVENIQNMAEEIKKKKAKFVFDNLKEITSKTGNVVNGKGQPFSFDIFMEMLNKISIAFDDQGNPDWPTLVVSPEMGAKLREKFPEWESNPDYKKRFENIIKRKRKEWNDRESYRKLVD